MTSAPPRRRIARAAVLIAAITVVARVVGFGRTVVYGHTVGASCVGDVYTTANVIPNIIFDVVAGGTLSALVVPILAPALLGQGRRMASRIVSALLTWTLLVMILVALALALLAGPLISLLLGDGQCPGAHALGTRMLVVFAPQVIFYGLGIVLGGALQAAERFAWPALAPLVSSLVVLGAYLVYGGLAGANRSAAQISRTDELVLSVGTTAGVAVLALCLLPAAARLGIRFRPTLRFPVGVARLARQAAFAGGATLGAQQLANAVMLNLANNGDETGAAVVVTIAQTAFLLPWAVLAVPIATSVYPRLAAAWDAGDRGQVAALAGRGIKVIAALAATGSAALIASSSEVARVMLSPSRGSAQHALAPSIAAFGAGLLGWSLVALLARALYAARRIRVAAAAQVVGWIVAVGADVVLAAAAPPRSRAVVLALGNTAGVSVAATLLVLAAWRAKIVPVLRPVVLDCLRPVFAGGLGALLGWSVSHALAPLSLLAAVLVGTLAGLLAAGVCGGVLAVLDPSLPRSVLALRPAGPSQPADHGAIR